jgi:membrane protein implicated in regulation of membrane protease activity
MSELSVYDWLAFSAVLLILEVFGAGGYLLWLGLAAAAVALSSYLLPLAWPMQLVLFAVFALLCVGLWWRYQRSRQPQQQPLGLNQRGSELLGREFVLQQAIRNGRGKIRAGDSLWIVTGPDMAEGQRVRVVAQNGVLLEVEAADPES